MNTIFFDIIVYLESRGLNRLGAGTDDPAVRFVMYGTVRAMITEEDSTLSALLAFALLHFSLPKAAHSD